MGPSKNLDPAEVTKLVSPFVDQATCLDCCKLYIVPETASCGHTSCHACWRKRRNCVWCAAPLNRRTLKLNVPIQIITEHVHNMCELFEKVFKFKVDTFSIGDGLSTELESEPDPTKNVNYWLNSSQNHFSAPISIQSTQDITTVEHLTSTVQVHSQTKKILSPQKIIHKQIAQDDWEKIEELPGTDELIAKPSKGNDSSQYSTEHPRRSSRKRELKKDDKIPKMFDASKDKCSSNNSSTETEIKNTKQKWNNVKKMRTEFSKLNKQNRNKLNVSIEMCKKTKANSATKRSTDEIMEVETNPAKLSVIDDDIPCDNHNIPQISKEQKQNVQSTHNTKNEHTDFKESQLNTSKKVPDDIQNKINKSKTNTTNILEEKEKNKGICNNDMTSDKIENISKMPFYKKGSLHIKTDREVKNNVQTVNYNIDCSQTQNADDIEITIKIGDTVANIFFKRKKNDNPKPNVNQEIQTSIGIHTLGDKSHSNEENIQNIEANVENRQCSNVKTHVPPSKINKPPVEVGVVNTSVSTKKNTASAETVTAQFEITDSVEKELSSVMELEEQTACNKQNSTIIQTKGTQPKKQILSNTQPDNTTNKITELKHNFDGIEYLDEQDIFDSGSVQESNVHTLRKVKNAPSEILMPTMKSKEKSQKKPEKRNREISEGIEFETTNKKQRIMHDSPEVDDNNDKSLQRECVQDSEGINYDAIMGQVFANIDADIHNTQKSKALLKDTQLDEQPPIINLDQQKTVVLAPEKAPELPINLEESCNDNADVPEGYSENVFTVIDREIDSNEIAEDKEQTSEKDQDLIENYLASNMFMEEGDKLCTPQGNADDDDKSVVEETPQKSVSFTKPKNKSENAQSNLSLNKQKSMHESQARSIVDVSDTESSSKASKEVTVVDIARKHTETPLTINKFVDQIKHKSTPVARKSLNFETDDDDPEQTLCPTTEPAKTTQEKEFMSKAFENTPKSPVRKPLMARNIKVDAKPYCLAGSCLSSMELMKVKMLCRQHNWKYVDKFTNELTHLVVGVDDENRSQRSVKYMCALAASKWIVSFRWIDACLNANKIVNEEFFEALDGTGEPGPKRSRIAKKKLFEGITFFCMPPFSVLDVDTLKGMLEAAGGKVVAEVRSVRAVADSPALLLAEPENTQENKFIYMAVELSVVPVNYEWVLNCLGSYSVGSVQELLLCPAALLPAATGTWPPHLIAQDD